MFGIAENLSLSPNKQYPPNGRETYENDVPGVLINRTPDMIIKSLGVVFWVIIFPDTRNEDRLIL